MELNSTLPLSQSPIKTQPLNSSSPSKLPIKTPDDPFVDPFVSAVDNRTENGDTLLKIDFRPPNLLSRPCYQSPYKTQSLNSSPSSSKLPIKRKSPDDPFISSGSYPKPPPFKFHRIWTEPDEIRFLQGLLNGSSNNLFFPRDLNAFYTNFSNTMSQPYTKNQLSEKLRRLRKKFRVISTRLSKGLDMSLLSPHDRSLYDLSKQLWHPDFAHTSPFNADNKSKKSRPKNDPAHDPSHHPTRDPTGGPSREGVWVSEEEDEVGQSNNENGDGNLSEVNVELETGDIMEEKRVDVDGPVRVGVGFGIEDIGAKVVMDVFDECLKDFRNGERSNLGGILKEESSDKFEERWREQRVAELDVLARRMRLVLEHSLQSQ